jgi:Icc protein
VARRGEDVSMAIVLHLSDLHLSAAPHTPVSGADPDDGLALTLALVADVRPDLVLLTGDISEDGSVASYERVAAAVDNLGAPVLALAGNHDEPVALASVLPTPTEVVVGAWQVVVVDTAAPDRVHGEVDTAAIAARLDALEARPTLVAQHHPPRSPSTNEWFALVGADAFLAALAARAHVAAVVSGHLHDPFTYRHAQLQLVGAPSTFYALAHDGEAYHAPPTGLVGAQLLHLGDDGAFTVERRLRSRA